MERNSRMKVTIAATSDLHGHLYPTDYRGERALPLGLARLARTIERVRREDGEMLLIDNGDLLQGTPLAYVAAHEMDIRRNHPMIAALNALRYDAAVAGNHEFNFGRELLEDAVKQSRFPWLAANIVDAATGQPAFGQPYVVKRLGGLDDGPTVAILGVTTHYIPNWERPEHLAGLAFTDAFESAKAWVRRIRREARPDVLVVCYHGGFERNPADGTAAEAETGENQGYAMLTELEGIDALITGHQHRKLEGMKRGVPFVQPGSFGEALGIIRLELVHEAGKWRIGERSAAIVTADADDEPDRELLRLAEGAERATQRWLDQPLGWAEEGLSIANPVAARLVEHPFVEFMNRVQMEASGAPISCTALFSDACKGFAGTITMRDIIGNYPFPNTLKVLRVSGQDVKDALEQSARYWTTDDDGNPQVHPSYVEPKAQPYNYDMWEGIAYRIDLAQPVGRRVEQILVDGKPIQAEGIYEVAMNNYRAAGGGEYTMFRNKPVVREIQTDMVELLSDYVRKHRSIAAPCDRNWKVYNSHTKS